MRTLTLTLGLGALATAIALAGAAPAAPLPYKKDPGPLKVETAVYDWVDAARGRTVPVRLYYPAADAAPAAPAAGPSAAKAAPWPVIVFSHGLGGTRDGYAYLGRHWAGHGYVSVHLQHPGSDDAAWRGQMRPMESMRAAAADLRNAVDRPLDARFAVDQLARLNRDEGPLRGRLDLDRLGIAGHSFGAYTTLAVAGQSGAVGGPRLADPRFKAAIPMSAPVSARPGRADAAYAHIRIPCLHMTGTLDSSLIGGTQAEQRRVPFDHIRGADQYLVTFTGGDHMIFSGRPLPGEAARRDAVFHDLICQSTTAFWDAYLKGDAAAKAWLADGGFGAVLGTDGVFEKRPAGAE